MRPRIGDSTGMRWIVAQPSGSGREGTCRIHSKRARSPLANARRLYVRTDGKNEISILRERRRGLSPATFVDGLVFRALIRRVVRCLLGTGKKGRGDFPEGESHDARRYGGNTCSRDESKRTKAPCDIAYAARGKSRHRSNRRGLAARCG